MKVLVSKLFLLFCFLLAIPSVSLAQSSDLVSTSQTNGTVIWNIAQTTFSIEGTALHIVGPVQTGTIPAECTNTPFTCSLNFSGDTSPQFNTATLADGAYGWEVEIRADLADSAEVCDTQSSVREAQGGNQGLGDVIVTETPEDVYIDCLRDNGLLPSENVDLIGSGTFVIANSSSGGLIVPVEVTDPGQSDPEANLNPVALCQDLIVIGDANSCDATIDVNDGSYDPDGSLVSITQTPPSPYSIGVTSVSLTVTDDGGASDNCQATVTVVDDQAPVIQCNSPSTITPPDAPITFSASSVDTCGVTTTSVTSYDCYKYTKKGKRVDKTESCVVNLSGNAVTITDSGGVDTFIEWTVIASDGNGNSTDALCSLQIANPGKGKK